MKFQNQQSKLRKGSLEKIGELLPKIKENLGLENSYKIQALKELWPLVTSFEIAKKSEPGYFDKDGNLVIAVKSSTLSTELLMMKNNILKKLKEATKNTDLNFKDLRFINKHS